MTLSRCAFTALLLSSLCAAPALAQRSSSEREARRDGRPISQDRGNLGNDSCDRQVRAKYPSGTLRQDARWRMVEACRAGRKW